MPKLIPPRNAACPDFLLGILIFKGLSARRPYKSFGVKGLIFKYIFICIRQFFDIVMFVARYIQNNWVYLVKIGKIF
jgi:hypothetical protein